jgi:hypothetical protein
MSAYPAIRACLENAWTEPWPAIKNYAKQTWHEYRAEAQQEKREKREAEQRRSLVTDEINNPTPNQKKAAEDFKELNALLKQMRLQAVSSGVNYKDIDPPAVAALLQQTGISVEVSYTIEEPAEPEMTDEEWSARIDKIKQQIERDKKLINLRGRFQA